MMQLCFPSIYWHFSIGHIELSDLEKQCNVYDGYDEWKCLIKTSKNINYNWDNFIRTIQPYFLQLPYKINGSLQFDDPWMNVYTKGCYQEAHQHFNNRTQLSYCYFSKLPKGSGKFGFWNELFRHYCMCDVYWAMDLDLVEWGYPEVKEGDLLIFPAFLIHQVTYHGIDEPRVTVSGNVRMIL